MKKPEEINEFGIDGYYGINETYPNPYLGRFASLVTNDQLVESLSKIATQVFELTEALYNISKEFAQLQKDVDLLKSKQGA
jgi:hypothetical protein